MNDYRDCSGKFIKGYQEPIEIKLKRIESMKQSWKNRKDYIGDIKDECPRIYGTWRSLMFTEKGKKAGIAEEWKNFRTFYNDVRPYYKKGKVFRRFYTNKIYSKDNFVWVTPKEAAEMQSNLVLLTYKGKTLSLRQWSDELNVSYNGIKVRWHRREKSNFTIKEILFGRNQKHRGNPQDIPYKTIRHKAIRFICQYKERDKKHNHEICDMDVDWMVENILTKSCIYCGDTNRVGCDRIDNSKGHIKTNVVPCCYDCNTARNKNFSYEEMKMLGKTIRSIKEARKHTTITLK